MASAVEKRARAAPRIQNILYTTDFSACSQAAAPYVAAIARRFGATVHLVHVLPPKLVAIGEYGLCIPEFEANRKPAVRKKLHDVCRSGLFDGILSSRILGIADLGEIRSVVAELVTMMNIDLIVLGTHGFRGQALCDRLRGRAACTRRDLPSTDDQTSIETNSTGKRQSRSDCVCD